MPEPQEIPQLTLYRDGLANLNGEASRVQLLEAEGLVTKVVTRLPTGLYRTLTPNPSAIATKAASNPYPEIPATPTRKFRE